jgi:hypothetical protein
MLNILLKFPTRSRPDQAITALKKYAQFATHPEHIGVALTCDLDDHTMKIPWITQHLRPFGWSRVFYGNSKTKIEACNADMANIEYPWDIVVLISDDMIPQTPGYDDIIRKQAQTSTDCVLWFNDGYQGNNLNTLTIFGRQMYDFFGYIYHPSYSSFYCDTELTDLCKTTLKNKCIYDDRCIIKHEHPGNIGTTQDDLYKRNQRFWSTDMRNYITRKTYVYDWTIMIPTLEERKEKYDKLVETLNEKHQRICPSLRLQILPLCDNREMSVGLKRDNLLKMAEGKYTSFIDDDDEITDAYFEDTVECISGNYDVVRLRGQISTATFTHSLSNKLDGIAAVGNEFLRPPNHLNVMTADVAKLIHFNDHRHGEDMDWMVRLAQAGYLKTEYKSDLSRIHYIYKIRKPLTESDIAPQRTLTCIELAKCILGQNVVPLHKKTLRLGPKGFVSV